MKARLAVTAAAALVTLGAHGADFAPAGAKATLTVEYRFESDGTVNGSPDGVYKERKWTVLRQVELAAELVAARPQGQSSMRAPDAAQSARLQQQAAQVQKAQQQMAPMMADAQAVVARCGNDQACIEREVMKMGAAMSGSPQLAQAQKTGRETAAAAQPDAPRYQRWQGATQTGRYQIAENWHVVHADPICMSLAARRCVHDMARAGQGVLPPTPSGAQIEFDLQANSLALLLPVPVGLLAYEETHTTDEPAGAHSTPVPRGPQRGQTALRVTAEGKSTSSVLTLPLQGGWRTQRGEQVVAMGAGGWHGASGEPGRLVVRWRFQAN